MAMAVLIGFWVLLGLSLAAVSAAWWWLVRRKRHPELEHVEWLFPLKGRWLASLLDLGLDLLWYALMFAFVMVSFVLWQALFPPKP